MEKWFFLGLLLVIIEACAGFTVILFILGIACISVGIFLQYAPDLIFLNQIVAMSGFVFIWAAILYPFLKKIRNRNKERYVNIIGQNAQVINAPLTNNSIGSIKWSGTIVRAQLFKGEVEIPVGDVVTIHEVKENIFIVKRKI